jgi:hypothetical protein
VEHPAEQAAEHSEAKLKEKAEQPEHAAAEKIPMTTADLSVRHDCSLRRGEIGEDREMSKLKALFIHNEKRFKSVFGPDELGAIGDLVDVYAPRHPTSVSVDNPDIHGDAEVLITGGSPPRMDKPFLDLAPRLKAVFHCAASIRKIVTEEFWRRGIVITSARRSNARAAFPSIN